MLLLSDNGAETCFFSVRLPLLLLFFLCSFPGAGGGVYGGRCSCGPDGEAFHQIHGGVFADPGPGAVQQRRVPGRQCWWLVTGLTVCVQLLRSGLLWVVGRGGGGCGGVDGAVLWRTFAFFGCTHNRCFSLLVGLTLSVIVTHRCASWLRGWWETSAVLWSRTSCRTVSTSWAGSWSTWRGLTSTGQFFFFFFFLPCSCFVPFSSPSSSSRFLYTFLRVVFGISLAKKTGEILRGRIKAIDLLDVYRFRFPRFVCRVFFSLVGLPVPCAYSDMT